MNSSPVALAVAFACALQATPQIGQSPAPVKPPYGKVHSLCVGVDQYSGVLGLDDIPVAAASAKAVGQYFAERLGYAPVALPIPNTGPTKANIEAAVTRANSLGADDVFIFYFAGHGVRAQVSADEERVFLIPTIMPPDGATLPSTRNEAIDRKHLVALEQCCLNVGTLARDLTNLPVKHVLVILDGCYSGAAIEGEKLPPLTAPRDCADFDCWKTRSLLTSALPGQQALYHKADDLTLFAKECLHVLEAAPVIRLKTLHDLVLTRVYGATNGSQYPQLRELQRGGGEFVFVRLGTSNWRNELTAPTDPNLLKGMGRGPDDTTSRASQGDIAAMATLFERNSGAAEGQRDDKAAFLWAREAYETGDPKGAMLLSQAYDKGIAVPRNPEKARRLYPTAPTHALPPTPVAGWADMVQRLIASGRSAQNDLRELLGALNQVDANVRQANFGKELKAHIEKVHSTVDKIQKRHASTLDAAMLEYLRGMHNQATELESARAAGGLVKRINEQNKLLQESRATIEEALRKVTTEKP